MEFLDIDAFVKTFPDEKKTEQVLMGIGALKNEMICRKCGEKMRKLEKDNRIVFRCVHTDCGKADVSVRSGSVFYGSKMTCRTIMKIARAWLQGESRNAAVRSAKVCRNSVTEWYTVFRELVAGSLRDKGRKIGGPGVNVQVDETKLGKRKYNKGHRVEGVWVVCGIERTAESRVFCVQVDSRDSESLREVIRQNVVEGSEVWTDGWKGYNGIAESCGVRHSTVNHSKNFKDPETGVCTNGVEGLNGALKAAVTPRHRTDRYASSCIAEFIWKRENRGRLCEAFLGVLSECLI